VGGTDLRRELAVGAHAALPRARVADRLDAVQPEVPLPHPHASARPPPLPGGSALAPPRVPVGPPGWSRASGSAASPPWPPVEEGRDVSS
jgi:hypothetical protein